MCLAPFLPFQLSKEFFHTLTQEHSSSFANAHYDCLMCAGVSARPQAQGSDLARFHPVRRNGVIEMRDDGKIMRNEAERQEFQSQAIFLYANGVRG